MTPAHSPQDSPGGTDAFGQILAGQAAMRDEIVRVHQRMDAWFTDSVAHREQTVILRTRQDRVISDLLMLEQRLAAGLNEVRERQAVTERLAEDVARKAATAVVAEIKGTTAMTVLRWTVGLLATVGMWVYLLWEKLHFPVKP